MEPKKVIFLAHSKCARERPEKLPSKFFQLTIPVKIYGVTHRGDLIAIFFKACCCRIFSSGLSAYHNGPENLKKSTREII